MVSSDRPVSLEDEVSHSMKEMIGGCCVCSDERGWAENPLVYCDGHGCSVAVHQGKHPTVRRAEPGRSQPSPLPPPGPQPPAPRPSPPRSAAGWPPRGRGGVGRACGRKCVWPALSCDPTLTQVSFGRRPRRDPGVWRLGPRGEEGLRGCGRGESGGRRGLPPSAVLPRRWVRARADPSPCRPAPAAAVCARGLPVAWNRPGSARRSPLRGVGEGAGEPGRFRLGREASAAAPPASGGDPAARAWELAAEKRAEGRAAVVLLQEWLWLNWLGLLDVCSGQIRPLLQPK